MKIIALSDIHGKTASFASLGDTLLSADLILITGDITHFGGKEALSPILDEIKKFNGSILAVFGNCDLPEVENGLQDAGIALHRRQVSAGGIVLAGLGGSLPCLGKTPNEFGEETLKKMLEDPCFSSLPQGGFVFVTHQPPCNTKTDKAWAGGHVGSRSIRDFIVAKRPFLCVTGHIHEGRGIDKIGDTLIVNPGPLKNGNYAAIEIERELQRYLLGKQFGFCRLDSCLDRAFKAALHMIVHHADCLHV